MNAMRTADRGFTLVELMIAVAVVAILAAVAMPSYREHVAASRRTDAKSALLAAAQALERYYTERGTYTGATLGATGLYPTTSPDGYYTLAITTLSADGYTLRATRRGGQTGDKCGNYTYNQAGTKGLSLATTGYTVAKCW
jgi:type IV pilus assembly protein PilE